MGLFPFQVDRGQIPLPHCASWEQRNQRDLAKQNHAKRVKYSFIVEKKIICLSDYHDLVHFLGIHVQMFCTQIYFI